MRIPVKLPSVDFRWILTLLLVTAVALAAGFAAGLWLGS
jgi:hypothetical protein